jgi:hypothetical protein
MYVVAPKKDKDSTSVDTSKSGDVNVNFRDIQSQGCDVRVQDIEYKYSV